MVCPAFVSLQHRTHTMLPTIAFAYRSSGLCVRRMSTGAVPLVVDGELVNVSPSEVLPLIAARRCERPAFCFDVDSTVITSEGIDVLASHCGAGEAVAEWTRKAMGGSVPFHEALEARLELIKPSTAALESCAEAHPLELTPGVHDFIDRLVKLDVDVYLVSGGFRQMIDPIAAVLGIPKERIFANNLLFSENDGSYAGFDADEPTSRAGGKARVVDDLKKRKGYEPLVMVGDGATDMEAKYEGGGADLFIGFGGIVVRDAVKNGADLFVTSFDQLIADLDV